MACLLHYSMCIGYGVHTYVQQAPAWASDEPHNDVSLNFTSLTLHGFSLLFSFPLCTTRILTICEVCSLIAAPEQETMTPALVV